MLIESSTALPAKSAISKYSNDRGFIFERNCQCAASVGK